MLRLLNYLGIPNVVNFSLSDPSLNLPALLSGFRISNRRLIDLKKSQRISRSNKYLTKQFKRLESMAKRGDLEAYDFLAVKLLKRSFVYRIYAMNAVFPYWIRFFPTKLNKITRHLDKIIQGLETDIDYKRVWIDKKPGDYGRPLGVPTLTWRVYLRMITNIAEAFASGRGLYRDLQHGGRPGKGVMTSLIEVSKLIVSNKQIYEFDLKGFFDHISHSSITEKFKGSFLEELFKGLLTSKPKSYILPPKEKDVASTKFDKIAQAEFEDDWGTLDLDLEQLGFIYINKPFYKWTLEEIEAFDHRLKELDPNSAGLTAEVASRFVSWEELDELDAIVADHKGKLRISEEYKTLMNPMLSDTVTRRVGFQAERQVEPPTKEDREQGRDDWKHLNLEHQGVPQGTSFGPFLASLVIGESLQSINKLVMYLDDGLIFFNEDSELEDLKTQLQEGCKAIQVEIEPSKSRVLNSLDLLNKGVKFLGTRIKKVGLRSYFNLSSETRRGTIKHIPEINVENALKILENMWLDGLITPSKYKITRWAILSSRMNKIIGSTVFDASIKYKYFGFLLSYLYDPNTDIEGMKNKIAEGTRRASEELKSSKGIGGALMAQPSWTYKGPGGIIEICKPTIYNASTLAIDHLLEMHDFGYVSLREFGLEFKEDRRPIFSQALPWVTKDKNRRIWENYT